MGSSTASRSGEAGACSSGAGNGEACRGSRGSNDGENRRGAPSPDRRKGRAGTTTSGLDACSDANGDASSDANGDDGSSDVSCYAHGCANGWFNVNTNGHGLWCYADGQFWWFASMPMAAVRMPMAAVRGATI